MMRSSTPRNDEAPRGGNRARPEHHIRETLICTSYRAAHLSAPAALLLLVLAAGGAR